MSKRTVISLVAVLALCIVFAGQVEAQAVVIQSPNSVNVIATPAVHGSLNFDPSNKNCLPTVPDVIISELLADSVQQLCWIRSSQFQGRIYGFATARYGVKSTAGDSCKLAQQSRQPRLTISTSSSGSLSSLSPPGLILRL